MKHGVPVPGTDLHTGDRVLITRPVEYVVTGWVTTPEGETLVRIRRRAYGSLHVKHHEIEKTP